MKCSISQRAASSKRLAVFGITLLAARGLLLACPFCSDNVATGMAKGFFWSILLMLAVPVVVVGTIAGVIWRASRPPEGAGTAPTARPWRAVGAGHSGRKPDDLP